MGLRDKSPTVKIAYYPGLIRRYVARWMVTKLAFHPNRGLGTSDCIVAI